MNEDPDMTVENEVQNILVSQQLRTSAVLDARVLAVAGTWLRADCATKPPVRRSTSVRVLAAVACVAILVWGAFGSWGNGAVSQPAVSEPAVAQAAATQTSPSEMQATGGQEVPGLAQTMGLPTVLGARETVRRAPVIAVVRVHAFDKISDGASVHYVVRAEVLEVLKGDANLVGTRVAIVGRNHRVGLGAPQGRALSFLSRALVVPQTGDAPPVCLLPLAWVPADGQNSDEQNVDAEESVFRACLSQFLQATRVADQPYAVKSSAKEDSVLANLRTVLLASLSDQDADIRLSAAGALRSWDNNQLDEDAPELWSQPATTKQLLAAGRDPDARVRWTIAWTVRSQPYSPGGELLRRLLFDVSPVVRQPAAARLKPRGHGELVAPIQRSHDWKFQDRVGLWLSGEQPDRYDTTSVADILSRYAQTEDVALRSAWLANLATAESTPPVRQLLLTALEDEAAELRQYAAFSLGSHSDERVLKALSARRGDANPHVRAMVGGAMLRNGEQNAAKVLAELLDHEDLSVALQAIEMLAVARSPASLGPLVAAVGDERPAVRGAAVRSLKIVLPVCGARTLRRVGQRVQEQLRDDPSSYVREATGDMVRQLGL